MSFGILPSPNIIRPITCVSASVCGVDMSNPNEPIPSVQPDPRICPQIFSVTCLIDEVVIRGSIRNSPLPLVLMLNMMICNRNYRTRGLASIFYIDGSWIDTLTSLFLGTNI